MLGSVVLLVVSLSWAVIADLVPSGDRPFIGSSTNNTVMELIIGHNDAWRVFSGSDPILTLDQFKKLVADGSIWYAMASTGTSKGIGFSGAGETSGNSNNAIMSWIKANGKVVPKSEWMDSKALKTKTITSKK